MATISEKIRDRILKFLRIEHYTNNPNSIRYTFINDEEAIIQQRVRENKIWYYGDSSELDNFYRDENIDGFPANPIYTENMRNYFRAQAIRELGFKKVHSGIPHAIADTLVNAVGTPKIMSINPDVDRALQDILCANDFTNVLNQKQLPMTLVEGWGAYKVNFDKNISDKPLIQYYEAENVKFATKYNKVIGIVYVDYYKYQGKDYVLLETRRVANGNSYIEFELFRQSKGNELTPVELHSLPELQNLPVEGYVIENYNKILGVPCKIFYDTMNKDYGRSIFMGKIDQFDMLDMILSLWSYTVQLSPPLEYYQVSALKRDRNGNPILPNSYVRRFIESPDGLPNGDGITGGNQVQTTQPNLNIEQYASAYIQTLQSSLSGLLSPATMGIDVAKKDNADAQREKEKVTMMTRNNINDREIKIVKELCEIVLDIQEYMNTGAITQDKDYQISVSYDEMATPTLDEKLRIWAEAFSNGIASPEMVVNMIYGDDLSDEEKQKEIAYIKEHQTVDNLQFGDIEDDNSINSTMDNEGQEEEAVNPIE